MGDDLSLDLFDGVEPVADSEIAPPPAPDGPKVWSVSQVNRAVRGLLESSVDPLWVGGEIGGWTRSRAGHCYFTLKDDRAQLRTVMFSREAQLLPTDPEEGMKVRVLGTLTLYEARGEYQLVAQQLEAEGTEGLWRLAFEKLRTKLEAEGLLEQSRKRPLPEYPDCVGVVTSPTGAALRDILSVLRRRAPWIRVILKGARVQGEGSALEVARALEALAGSGLPDVIIVGRGGGSVEDLWAFNEEPLARAIAASPVPVVSAVGHEIDVTISDLVADLRAPTPSAAAESVVPEAQAIQRSLVRTPTRLAGGVRAVLGRRRTRVDERLLRLGTSIEHRLRPVRQALDVSSSRMEHTLRGLTDRRRQKLEAEAGRLEALSPLATLARGYSVAQGPDGRVLRRVADFEPDTDFRLRVNDGSLTATVQAPTEE